LQRKSSYQHPGAINWTRISLLFALGIALVGNLAAPIVATAQNLGTSPQFGQAVQSQQATTVEGILSALSAQMIGPKKRNAQVRS
jgi:hypothetical protein